VVTSVPAVTYTTGSDTAVVSAGLTDLRQGAAIGLVAQSSVLDQAAASHTAFLVNNGLVANGSYLTSTIAGELGGHYEDSTLPGFTGSTPQSRAVKAGYAGTAGEVITFGAASGLVCINSLRNSVYHLALLMSPFVDAGISFNAGNGTGSVCAIELGIKTGTLGQLPAAGSVSTFPYSGQTGVAASFDNHAETPVPAPDLTLTGRSVEVSLYTLANPALAGSDIVLQQFAMTQNGTAIPARILAASGVTGAAVTTDTNLSAAGIVVLLPLAPLSYNTVYTVTFAGTVKGVAVTYSWSFTTKLSASA
jgi:hypothetical protein